MRLMMITMLDDASYFNVPPDPTRPARQGHACQLDDASYHTFMSRPIRPDRTRPLESARHHRVRVAFNDPPARPE